MPTLAKTSLKWLQDRRLGCAIKKVAKPEGKLLWFKNYFSVTIGRNRHCWGITSLTVSDLTTLARLQNMKTGEMKHHPLLSEDQICGHLENLKLHKSLETDKTHPQVLKELTNEVAKPLSIIFEDSWQSLYLWPVCSETEVSIKAEELL